MDLAGEGEGGVREVAAHQVQGPGCEDVGGEVEGGGKLGGGLGGRGGRVGGGGGGGSFFCVAECDLPRGRCWGGKENGPHE